MEWNRPGHRAGDTLKRMNSADRNGGKRTQVLGPKRFADPLRVWNVYVFLCLCSSVFISVRAEVRTEMVAHAAMPADLQAGATAQAQATLPATGHSGHALIGWVPEEILNRPVQLRAGIGTYHEKVTTSSATAQKFYDQGTAYLHSYVWIEAARSFHQALRNDPRMAMAYLGLSYAYSPMDYAASQAALRQASSLDSAPGSQSSDREQRRIRIRALQLNAMARAGSADASRALLPFRQALDDALAAYPDDVELLLLRGHAEEPTAFGDGQGCVPSALPYYQRALALSPDNFAAHHFLTHCYENEGKFADAVEHGRIYAALAPDIPHAQHMYAHELRCVGRIAEAIQFFLKADAIGQSYYRRENIPPALDWHDAHNLALLASAYQYTGQMRKARHYFEQEHSLTPFTAYAAYNRRDWPEFLLNHGELELALAAARQLAGSPSALARVTGHALAGSALVAAGSTSAASQELQAARQEFAQLGSADAGAVVSYVEGLQLELAMSQGPASEIPPLLSRVTQRIRAATSADSWSQGLFRLEVLARLARDTGHWDIAEQLARQMLGDDAYYGGSHYALALVAAREGDAATAKTEFLAAQKYWAGADPDLPQMAQIHRSIGFVPRSQRRN